jgi:hypothetical protein
MPSGISITSNQGYIAFMPRRGYLLVANAYHRLAAGVAACFWEAMVILTPEIAACWMERLPNAF